MDNLFDELLHDLREEVERTADELRMAEERRLAEEFRLAEERRAAELLESGRRALARLEAIAVEVDEVKQMAEAVRDGIARQEAELRSAAAVAKAGALATIRAQSGLDPKAVVAAATESLLPFKVALDELLAQDAEHARRLDALAEETRTLADTPGMAEAREAAAAAARRAAEVEEQRARLAHLKAHIGQPKSWKDSSHAVDGLTRFLDALQQPSALTEATVDGELKRLERAVAGVKTWTSWPTSIQRDVLALVTCRLRYAKTMARGLDARFKAAFSALNQYSRDHQPGYVNGLTEKHGPKGNTWLDDARYFWDQLDGPHLSPAPMPPPVKKNPTPRPAEVEFVERETVGSVTRAAATRFAETLVFTVNAFQTADDSPYAQPDKVRRALEAMDAVCRARRDAKAKGTSMGGLEAAFEQHGFEYKAHQSEVTKSKWASEYQMIYRGERVSIEPHLSLGAGPPQTCLRIHFWTDEEMMQFVIDHVGRHKTNTKS